MTTSKPATRSYWMEAALPSFPPLDRELEVDVVIVGAGITGVTTAYLLRREGARVALLERDRIGAADSGRTTAHLTYVTDHRLSDLVEHFGRDAAKVFWEAGAAALDEISRNVEQTNAQCEFRWVNGYLHEPIDAKNSKERERLKQEADLAQALGFDATFLEHTPLLQRCGVRFSGQAKFHPRKYLGALVEDIAANGGYLFESTDVQEFEDEPFSIRANGHRIRCKYLVLASHNPRVGEASLLRSTLLQTKLALYTTYVVGARAPNGLLPDALFWDTRDPYEYLRIDSHADHDFLIFGGNDVKTGQEHDHDEIFRDLERRLTERFSVSQPTHRWLGQVIETDDGLPLIGENMPRQFIATGFAGNGYTLGTIAAMMARDAFLGRKNPWSDLFKVNRKPFHGGLWRYVSENVDFPYYFLRNRLAPAETDALEDVANGEGKIVAHEGRKVAAYRNDEGELTLLSPVCTHLQCLVRWNGADRTWDCPCHGSRFAPTGAVLSGPAEAALNKFSR